MIRIRDSDWVVKSNSILANWNTNIKRISPWLYGQAYKFQISCSNIRLRSNAYAQMWSEEFLGFELQTAYSWWCRLILCCLKQPSVFVAFACLGSLFCQQSSNPNNWYWRVIHFLWHVICFPRWVVCGNSARWSSSVAGRYLVEFLFQRDLF